MITTPVPPTPSDERPERHYALRDDYIVANLVPGDVSRDHWVSWANSVCIFTLAVGILGWQTSAKARPLRLPPPQPPTITALPPVELPTTEVRGNDGSPADATSGADSKPQIPDLPTFEPAPIGDFEVLPVLSLERLPLKSDYQPPSRLPGPQPRSFGSNPAKRFNGAGNAAADGSIRQILQDDLPKAFRNRQLRLEVKMVWSVGPDGDVYDIHAERASQHPELDRFLADWIKRNGRFPASGAEKRLYHVFEFRVE